MKVSVVIPTYFRPNDLSELLESILMQSIKPLEVIIVDDTPSNVIEEIYEAYDSKFKRFNIKLAYVRNYKERSAAIARNIGACTAKGDIVLFLDSDVVLHPRYMEGILKVFEKKENALGVQG